MSGDDLRPTSTGEILDRTFSLYRGHFLIFTGIMAVPTALVVVISLVWQLLTAPRGSSAEIGQQLVNNPGLWALVFATSLISIVSYAALYSIGMGATALVVSDLSLGQPTSINGAYRRMRGRLGSMMNLFVTLGIRGIGVGILAILVGAAVFIFPAAMLLGTGSASGLSFALIVFAVILWYGSAIVLTIFVMLRYGVAVPALVVETLKAREAIKRSVALTKGHRLRVFAVMLLMGILNMVAMLVFQAPFMIANFTIMQSGPVPVWLQSAAAVSGGIGAILSSPFLMIALSLLYYDLRVRKEAFDLQHLISTLDVADPAPASPA